MKTIIYAGIALFSVATVYGVADYYSSKQKGTLDKLYVEEEAPVTPVKIEEPAIPVVPVKEITVADLKKGSAEEKTAPEKKLKSRKSIKMEDFSRARIPEEVIVEEIKEEPAKKQEEKVVEQVVEKETTIAPERAETERTITMDKFSRAPLKKIKVPAKKETVKN